MAATGHTRCPASLWPTPCLRSASGAADAALARPECSSLAPYWIPEQIKHYFRHRHSATDGGEISSQKTDAALHEIGNEMELSADDESGWMDKCCRDRRYVLLTTITVALALFICLLLGELLLHFHGAAHEAEAPSVVRSSGDRSAAKGPVGGADDGDYPMPAPRDTRKRGLPGVDVDYPWPDNFWTKDIALLSESANPRCGKPAFKACSGGPPEFYYNHTSHTCVALTREVSGLCNRGLNRFTSMESCRHECVDGKTPAAECYEKTTFTECQARDVVGSWWWYLEGRGCRRWRFPRGRCPSVKAEVFRTSLECIRRCAHDRERGHGPCRVPAAVLCQVQQLRFGFFADAATNGSRARLCREIPSTNDHQARLRCLVGDNKFSTMEACRKTCLRATP
ncbi:hypothetical protein MTO96_012775 [Rhipicephalus appendiculatus]